MLDSVSRAGEQEQLDARLRKLAEDKSNLELIIQMMNRMSRVPGLENTIENMLHAVGDLIGGVNLVLYYQIDEALHYTDLFGMRGQVGTLEDALVAQAFQTGEAVEEMHDFADTRMITEEFSKAYTWAVPLQVGSEVVGVLKMENLHLAMKDLSHRLPTFFNYAGLVLKNEIRGETRLRKLCDDLARENVDRERAEEALRVANEDLERKVRERTVELEQANEALLARESQVRALLEQSESHRRALLSILEDQQRAEEEERRLNRELLAISTCNQALLHATDEQTLLDEICRIICEQAGYRMAWVGYPVEDGDRSLTPVAQAGVNDGYLEDARISWADVPAGRGPSGRAFRERRSIYVSDIATDPLMAPWRDRAIARGYRSVIALPLKGVAGAVLGTLQIYAPVPDAVSLHELQLLEELAGDLAYGIQALRTRAERDRAERDRLDNLKFFESMDLINRALQGADDKEDLMREVLGTVVTVFDCDRAWLAYPCDPNAATWNIPMESTKTGFPGLFQAGEIVAMQPETANVFRAALASEVPICAVLGDPGGELETTALRYAVQSQITMAIYPGSGKPYMFGLHQCTEPRIWTDSEKRLFQEIGRRIADRIARIEALETLQENERKLKEAQNVAHLGHWETDLGTGRTLLSDETRRIFGLPASEAIEHLTNWQERLLELIHPEDREAALRAAASGLQKAGMCDLEYRIVQPGGEVRFAQGHTELTYDESGQPRRIFGTVQDITERRRIEKALEESESRLRQSQKLEAIGQLAGGVAHDFNNMLSVILGHAELALLKTGPDDPWQEDLQGICAAARRSADLTRQLLGFARKQTVVPRVLDLNETVESMLKMMRRLIGEDIELNWLPGSVLWPIKVDPSQIDQILANLCVNARDAISGGGRVRIETSTITIDNAFCAANPEAIPGDFVSLSVSDTGCGMTPETAARVFEPFFTTKALGKGTGLGLATIYGIVRQNNGFIRIDSAPGRGTTLCVYFPRHHRAEERVPQQTPETPVESGHETILLVEDEPGILHVTSLLLERCGYKVLGAPSPGEALRMAREYAGPLHLLLTDVVMPEMNGWKLAQELTRLHPGLRCLFMSGYTGNIVAEQGLPEMEFAIIQKPFNMQVLTSRVRATLDGKRG